MTASKAWLNALFLLAGSVALVGPVLREIWPGNPLTGVLSLEQFLALELHAALLAFWARRASFGKRWLHILGPLLLAGAAFASGFWMIRFFGTVEAVFLTPTAPVIGFGVTTILLVLGAGIGAAGWPLIAIVASVLAFGFLGQFAFLGATVPPTSLPSFITYLSYGSDGLFGRALDIITNLVLIFVIFGVCFEVAGGGRVIANIALRCASRSRANAIKACVIASGLFGTVSGAATSNVVTSGTFSIPSMRRIGVRNETAAGIEAAASTCGQIMPPVLGAAAFFLAELAEVAYSTVVIASIGPALACYYAFFRQADLVPLDAGGEDGAEAPEPLRAVWLLYMLPPAAIISLLLQSSAFVSLAAIAGTATCLLIAVPLQGLIPTLRLLRNKMAGLILSVVNLVIVAASVGLLLGVLYSTGLTVAGAVMIGKIGQEHLLLALLLTGFSAFVLGMGVATVGVYIVAATLLTPGLIEAGIPVLAAHFFVLYCGILSLITPPIAFASLAASALAKSDFTATSFAAMRFGWILFVIPFVIALSPGLLMLGSWMEIATAYLTTFVFVAATTARLGIALKLALMGLSASAILWPGADWQAVLIAVCVVGFLGTRSHMALRRAST